MSDFLDYRIVECCVSYLEVEREWNGMKKCCSTPEGGRKAAYRLT